MLGMGPNEAYVVPIAHLEDHKKGRFSCCETETLRTIMGDLKRLQTRNFLHYVVG